MAKKASKPKESKPVKLTNLEPKTVSPKMSVAGIVGDILKSKPRKK